MPVSTETSYYLLLADIQGSTRLDAESLARLTDRLARALSELSHRYSGVLALPLRQQYGDEVAALLHHPTHTYAIADGIREAAYPTALRYVVTYGRVGQSTNQIPLLGGPIFKNAQALMQALKRQRAASRWDIGPPFERQLLQALSDMIDALSGNLTNYRRQVWRLLREELSQQDAAARLAKKPQSVSRAASQGNILALTRGERALESVLQQLASVGDRG